MKMINFEIGLADLFKALEQYFKFELNNLRIWVEFKNTNIFKESISLNSTQKSPKSNLTPNSPTKKSQNNSFPSLNMPKTIVYNSKIKPIKSQPKKST